MARPYLVVRSLALGMSGPDVSKSDIVVFTTRPEGDVKSWQWRYIGKLAGAAEAKELGADGLTQIEIARGVDGKLLALVTPDRWTNGDFVHEGCRVLDRRHHGAPREGERIDDRLPAPDGAASIGNGCQAFSLPGRGRRAVHAVRDGSFCT